jgi:hypothetical protein
MKLVFRTIFFHLLCILFFAILYYNFKNHFYSKHKTKITNLDYFFLSTTIQSGVGVTDIYPSTMYSKILLIIQQFIMIMTNVFTIYILNI